MNSAPLYDMHNHSFHSHDGHSDIKELCEKAFEMGLAGFAVTDHFDNEWSDRPEVFSCIVDSFKDTGEKMALYDGKLEIFRGVEVGEAIWLPENATRMIGMCDFDLVLGSIHYVRYKGHETPYSLIDFSHIPEEDVRGFYKLYYEELLEMAQTQDYDVLTHLTCPLRYLNGKYGYHLSPTLHSETVDAILKTVIECGKALEVNSSCVNTGYDELMPTKEILERYYAFGGRMVTIGSDSHVVENFGKGLERARSLLKQVGFKTAYYYRRRKPYAYAL